MNDPGARPEGLRPGAPVWSKRPVPPRRLLLAALLAAFAVRLPALLLGMEHYGDGPVRVEIAERWARAPHLWRGFSEAFQFGPLHLTLLGGTLELWPDRIWAPRALSLLCGLAAVWLLFRIAKRLLGPAAAFAAALGLALSPLHIQASTTSASEAPFLALLLGAIDLLLADRLVLSALLLGAAGMVRYDGWLYVPLIAGWLLLRRVALPQVALFCALAVLPVPLWLWLNHRFSGDWLAPIHYIDRDHQALAAMALGWFGQLRWRAYCLVYWPLAVLLPSTPVLGLLSLAGAPCWRTSAPCPGSRWWQPPCPCPSLGPSSPACPRGCGSPPPRSGGSSSSRRRRPWRSPPTGETAAWRSGRARFRPFRPSRRGSPRLPAGCGSTPARTTSCSWTAPGTTSTSRSPSPPGFPTSGSRACAGPISTIDWRARNRRWRCCCIRASCAGRRVRKEPPRTPTPSPSASCDSASCSVSSTRPSTAAATCLPPRGDRYPRLRRK